MTFEEYLISKKINGDSFQKMEPALFESWKSEFAHLHPISFTSQKLYLINPIRRKYPLKIVPVVVQQQKETVSVSEPAPPVKSETTSGTEAQPPKPARPVFKPKPKIS